MCRAFQNLSRTQINGLITEWIHDERDRDLIRRRLLDGVIYERLAEEFELSVTQVKSICYKAQRRLIDHI
jgi:hypothetical protein